MAVAIPQELAFDSIALPAKPSAPIRYALVSSPRDSTSLVVFLNGLGLPQVAWHPCIAMLLRQRKLAGKTWPPMLTYDRYGQGQTVARDPSDKDKPPGETHDAMDVVRDLHSLIAEVAAKHELRVETILFVVNSIGGPLARLYAQSYPSTVAAMIILDSNMANTDFVSIFPDPDAPGYAPHSLPEGVTTEHLRDARAGLAKLFSPTTPNPEGFNRSTLPALLPLSTGPRLKGPGGKGPLVYVVGHDWDRFAEEGEQGSFKTPRAVTMNYTNPFWHRYNQELLHITDAERARGPIIAEGAGHFIQRDDPAFVAGLVDDMLNET